MEIPSMLMSWALLVEHDGCLALDYRYLLNGEHKSAYRQICCAT